MTTFYYSNLTGISIKALSDGATKNFKVTMPSTRQQDSYCAYVLMCDIKPLFKLAMTRHITASNLSVREEYKYAIPQNKLYYAIIPSALRKARLSGDRLPDFNKTVHSFWKDLYEMYPKECFKYGLYTSSEDSSLVAYTERKPNGSHSRIKTTLGRFLSRKLEGVTPQLLKSLADEYRLLATKPNLKFATSSDEVKWVYATAGSSCMSNSDCEDAVTVYADCEHVAVAYFTDSNGEPRARAVVNTRDKLFATCYGDSEMLEAILVDSGYTASDYTLTQDGIYLSFRGYMNEENLDVGVVCPFIDPVPKNSITRWVGVVMIGDIEYLHVYTHDSDGDEELYGCNSRNHVEGYSTPKWNCSKVQCAYSDEWVNEDSTTYIDNYGYVESCYTVYSEYYNCDMLKHTAFEVYYCSYCGNTSGLYTETSYVLDSDDYVSINGDSYLVESLEKYPNFAMHHGICYYEGEWISESDLPKEDEDQSDDLPTHQ
jgi:hypothetical protein